jgi:Tripartite ATP-independent periplasmic transporters, DctQ component
VSLPEPSSVAGISDEPSVISPPVFSIAMRFARVVALMGGFLMLAVAVLVCLSILGRASAQTGPGKWLGLNAIPGDFEIVQMATALAVFAFLPLCQANRGNIIVNTFSTGWRVSTQRIVDGVHDLIYAGFMALFGWLTLIGGREAMDTHTSSMVLALPLWPVFFLCGALALLLALVSVATAIERFRGAVPLMRRRA